jgi:hypothetical protein
MAWLSTSLPSFCGRSGAGKSTMARLWRRLAPQARLLSDDRIVLRPSGTGVRAWGTPWHGEGGFAAPDWGPLGAVFFLRHGRTTRLRPLFPAEAAVPAFELAFRPDRSAIAAAQAAVQGPRA